MLLRFRSFLLPLWLTASLTSAQPAVPLPSAVLYPIQNVAPYLFTTPAPPARMDLLPPLKSPWVVESSQTLFSRGPTLHFERDDGQSPSNAVLNTSALLPPSDPAAAYTTSRYWSLELPVMPKSLFVGVARSNVTSSALAQGYRFRFLGYGGPGNLIDGGSALLTSWGPPVSGAKQLGVLAEFAEGRLNVYFYRDRVALGLAYSLPAEAFPEGVKLAVQASGPGQVVWVPTTAAEEPEERERHLQQGREGLADDWVLVGSPIDDLLGRTFRITIEQPSRDTLVVRSRVINSRRGTYTRSSDGHWVAQPGISTRMGGSPALMQLENELNRFLDEVVNFTLSEDGAELALTAADGQSAVFQRAPQTQPRVIDAEWLIRE